MKQLLQSLQNGQVFLVDVPIPQVKPGHLLIRTTHSLVSAGTERMLLDFGRASLIGKARSQPEKVKAILDKVMTDGLVSTVDAVRQKIAQPIPLGYCNVGTVVHTGAGVDGIFNVGDLVVNNGSHAELVCVPQNLCCPIPASVSGEHACYTVLGAVGLQGIRLANPTLGEKFVVLGLGLIGLLTIQILRANGCQVMGIDPDAHRRDLASQLGANCVSDPAIGKALSAAAKFSGGAGVDGVIITASTTDDQPIHLAAQMCRQRGRLVLVGTTGLQLRRDDFYKKELSFQVSCAYGPGRYDPQYEEKGCDYPPGLVRWSLQRNFEAVLGLLAKDQLAVSPLTTHMFDFPQAREAYEMITQGKESYLGVIFRYPLHEIQNNSLEPDDLVNLSGAKPDRAGNTSVVVGVIGAGNFAARIALPALATTGSQFDTIASSGGTSAAILGKKFGFSHATTNLARIFDSHDINAVYIATKHDSHAALALRGLRKGKNVLVEKPLCVSLPELDEIKLTLAHSDSETAPILMVGFNRRFAPMTQTIKRLLHDQIDPICINILINAGELPIDHWTLDPIRGGGRLVGEACHFIDLCRFLIGSPVVFAQGARLGRPDASRVATDKLQITLNFADGSLATIQYLANGHRSFPKERIELFCSGKIIQLTNFRDMKGFGWSEFRRQKSWRQDKGHAGMFASWVNAIEKGAPAPIPLVEIIEVTQLSLDLAQGLQDSPTCQLSYSTASSICK